MGLTVSLQDENRNTISQVIDPANLLHRQLTMGNEGLLGGIDWYGDTTFNGLQMRQFIPAWETLIHKASDPNEIVLLKDILALAQESLKDVHQYIKFEGD